MNLLFLISFIFCLTPLEKMALDNYYGRSYSYNSWNSGKISDADKLLFEKNAAMMDGYRRSMGLGYL